MTAPTPTVATRLALHLAMRRPDLVLRHRPPDPDLSFRVDLNPTRRPDRRPA